MGMFSQYTKEFNYNLKLAFPVMLGMISHTLVGLVDNLMVGQLGATELAAVSLGNSFMFIAISLGIGFSTAITPLTAEADAADNIQRARDTFKHGVVLCALLGIILLVGVLVAKPLMYSMNQPTEVVPLAMPYLTIVGFSLLPFIIFQAFKQFSDGLSMTKTPMYAGLIANVVNMVLNYLLIFGKFGFPKMGVEGAAIGTLVSRVIMVIVMLAFLRGNAKSKQIVQGVRFLILRSDMLKKIVSLGLPSAMQMFFEVAIFTAAIWLSGILGTNPQAANQIVLNLSAITFMVAMGLSVAATVRTGNQKGLQRYRELRRIAFSIFVLAFLISGGFAMVFVLGNQFFPELYLNANDVADIDTNAEVISIAAQLLIIAALFQISDGIQVTVLGALRGVQDVKIPTAITFIAYWLIGFPISFYLGLYTDFKSTGIWIGLLAGLTASAVLLFLRFNYLTKQLILSKE